MSDIKPITRALNLRFRQGQALSTLPPHWPRQRGGLASRPAAPPSCWPKHGLPVRDVAELTGFPEMMDRRVKTLHPASAWRTCWPYVFDNRRRTKQAMAAHGIGAD